MPFPYGQLLKTAHFSVSEAAVAAETSGVSLEAGAGGQGLLLTRYEPANATVVIALRQHLTSAPLLDANLATVTPLIRSFGALTHTVIRTGRDSAGVVAAPPDYFFRAAAFSPLHPGMEQIFIPPGSTLTLFAVAANTAFDASLAIAEYGPRPS